jgi:Negative regulator of beta-lactamase expression
MRPIRSIIVHCSATPPDMDIGVETIDGWHRDRGWASIGYHYVIRRNGRVETGRNIEHPGAHARGANQDSVGVCLVGGTDADDKTKAEANFTLTQYRALEELVWTLRGRYGSLEVMGHRDLPGVRKACPCFDVRCLFS